MKVLDITEFYSERGGGVRTHLTEKARALGRRGVQHCIVAPGPRSEEHAARAGDVTTKVVRLKGPHLPYDATYHLLGAPHRTRTAIARERPDVLEINSPYLAAAWALSLPRNLAGIRTFFWHADVVDTYFEPYLSKRLPALATDCLVDTAWQLLRGISNACDVTIVTSRSQQEKLASRGFPRLRYVPFGVDRAVFTSERRDLELRKELLEGAPEGTRLLVAVGRLAVEKRWDVVLSALRVLGPRHRFRLVVLGDGPERPALERVSRDLPVRFWGFERDRVRMAGVLASADLLVHGCGCETFGLSIAEAAAAGLPVVVPDTGGAAEVVRGSSAERYRANDPVACAAAIARMLAREPGELRAAAEAAARDIPSNDQHFDRVIELYRECLDSRRGGRAS